jgi:restriction endonuclease S subunit
MGVNAVPKYRFEEIAYNSTEKKIPSEDDKHTYIGLEHLDSGTMTVTRWGSEVAPIGEKLVMRKGDVLFGKRRAYQKKVAIAPFDGIFSAHGMVLRPKEKAVTKEFFPLFISSDYFLNEAIRISVGSLSPTINWRDLKELEFSLPTIEEQSRISPLIWAAIRAKEAYKKMLESTDNLVKSQFIEMLAEANDVLMSVRAPVGSTNVATKTCCLGRGLAGIRPIEGKSTTMFILYSMRSIEDDIENMGVGSTFKAINKDVVYNLPIPIASIELQNRFVALAEQSDKSKFELQQSITRIDNLIKSLIQGTEN